MSEPNAPRRVRRRATIPGQRVVAVQRPDAGRPPKPQPPRVITRIEISGRTILQIILTLVAIVLFWRLRSIFLQVFIAAILAAALYPAVARLQRRGFPRGAAIITVFGSFIGIVALVVFLIAQPLVEEAQQFIEDLPGYIEQARGILDNNQDLYNRITEAANSGAADPSAVIDPLLTAGRGVVTGLSGFVIVLIMAVYILLEGEKALNWLTRDLSPQNRYKLRKLMPELIRVVSGYVTGQAINSTLFATFAFTVLTIFGVPQPLLLAVIAAFADAIPIVGVPLATIPAVLLAFTVSPATAGFVAIAYIAYQQIENYIIVPRVFQGTLQISPFAVLLAVLIGTNLLGVIGAILALPVAAAIPVIERVWLGEDIPEEFAELAEDRPEDGAAGFPVAQQVVIEHADQVTVPPTEPQAHPTGGERS